MPGRGSVCFRQHSLCQMEPLGQNKILTDNPINAYFPSGYRQWASVHNHVLVQLFFKFHSSKSGSSIFLFQSLVTICGCEAARAVARPFRVVIIQIVPALTRNILSQTQRIIISGAGNIVTISVSSCDMWWPCPPDTDQHWWHINLATSRICGIGRRGGEK